MRPNRTQADVQKGGDDDDGGGGDDDDDDDDGLHVYDWCYSLAMMDWR